MAVQVNVILNNGITVNNAYARINTVGGTKEYCHVSVRYYKDKQAFEDGKEMLKEDIYEFIPSVEDGSLNWIKQGYEYIKTLPQFNNVIDV